MTYQPPGNINDFARHPATEQALRQRWHNYIKRSISRRDGNLFYDADADPTPGTQPARAPIPWNGFPRSLWEWFNAESDPQGADRAFATAEIAAPLEFLDPRLLFRKVSTNMAYPLFARQQDEYCEWFADRDANGGITRISFTCEGPEYWEEMWREDPALVVELYREILNPPVSDAQLRTDLSWPDDMKDPNGAIHYRAGSYNRWNKWTTTHGAMHLTHPANTLGAEINLAADATIVRPSVAEAPAASLHTRLICCAGYGGVNRSSDPLIGKGVNDFARRGLCVTLDNPVGLYIDQDLKNRINGLLSPTGQPIGPQSLNVRRVSPDGSVILRAELTPPPGANFTLDQCRFDGVQLAGGGPIARRITMVLFGLAKQIPGRVAKVVAGCDAKCCKKPQSNFLAAVRPTTNCSNLNWPTAGPFEGGAVPQSVAAAFSAPVASEAVEIAIAGSRGVL